LFDSRQSRIIPDSDSLIKPASRCFVNAAEAAGAESANIRQAFNRYQFYARG
jgi:hypothetical protein